jgi:hypothetical protein
MAEELSLLSSTERIALDLEEALPRARAIQAWLRLAAERELPDLITEQGVDYLRTLSQKRLKRIRRELASATKLIDDMPFAFLESRDETVAEKPEDARDVVGGETKNDLELSEQASEAIEHQSSAVVDPSLEDFDFSSPFGLDVLDTVVDVDEPNPPDTLEDKEVAQGESSEVLAASGLEWAKKLLGDDYDFTDKSLEDVANDVYVRAGSFRTRRQPGGGKIDPIERIILRLQGVGNGDIARKDNVDVRSVWGWFNDRIDSKIITPSAQSLSESESESESESMLTESPLSNEQLSELWSEAMLLMQLEKIGFSSQEAGAVNDCIGFDESGQSKPRLAETTVALQKLQLAFVKNDSKLDKEADKDIMAALRMLTNTAFGQKTVRDVYYKLHGKNQSVTLSDVTILLRDGIIKLIS